ncbi:MAG TPA: FecR domain-containing protein [Rhodocyclaceae bacterium]|nr:FecR domain-containing protein [Rhodocyclaceae bacterium]HMZ84679.1 FecR domain-containing protein [Rhodocyclaceae bacterium]HNA03590.1 FecR domain-containing protein [Rhodocyclaceae bacterium]HNB77576.1 FecR domain-containing protein [Rhodocyclaceae bacterium]HNC62693.1 FecR domain-containing protein [Rhodocyclaceae bacterium]
MGNRTRHAFLQGVGFILPGLLLPAQAQDMQHVVRAGENPWTISAQLLRSMAFWPRLVSYNRIADPLRIAPGTVLRIPEAWLAQRAAAARVLGLEGEVTMTDPAGRTVRLSPGDLVPQGARIATGAQDSLSLGLIDNSRVLIKSGSEIRLEANAEDVRGKRRNILFDLRRGAVENDVERRSSSGGRFEIRTPAAVAAVRGTRFRIAAQDENTSAEVLDGGVDLRNVQGSVELKAGYASRVAAQSAPQPARPMLPAPDLGALPARIERVPTDLGIAPLAGATGYRSQIGYDEQMAALLFDQTTALPVARVRDLPDGEYLLRVRGVDADGLEGFDATRRITIDARPEPPFAIAPADDTQLSDPRPAFKWTRRDGTLTYRFQLARDAAFAQPLHDRSDIRGDTVALDDDLAPGEYFWRIAAIDEREGQGPFGSVQRLRRVPGAPALKVQSDGQKPAVRWQPGGPDERFQLQVAREPGFAAPVVDLTLSTPDAPLPALESGQYYLRARTIAGDGYVGDWGPVQQFDIKGGLSPALLLLLLPLLLAL